MESPSIILQMPRPGVIRPRAPLVRDAVRIELAAQNGEIADAQVTKTARFILSFMTEMERVSLSSRGKIEGYDPPVERFREAAEAFITKFEKVLHRVRLKSTYTMKNLLLTPERTPLKLKIILLVHSINLLQRQLNKRPSRLLRAPVRLRYLRADPI
jgi:hypothetical protein